jgi:DnaK suppressor protein
MNTEQASPFQQQLLALRAQVLAQLAAQRGGTVGRADVAAEHFGHPEDSRAQVNTERDIEVRSGRTRNRPPCGHRRSAGTHRG